jgi:hypothetical protein
MKFKVEVKGEIEVTGQKLADLFWNMHSDEQADFFNALGAIDPPSFEKQLSWVESETRLDKAGRYAMRNIGIFGGEPS